MKFRCYPGSKNKIKNDNTSPTQFEIINEQFAEDFLQINELGVGSILGD